MRRFILAVAVIVAAGRLANAADDPVPLFPDKGVPKGWVVRTWNDASKLAGKDRPKKGHIGFQHLSRENEPIQIRNVKLKELN